MLSASAETKNGLAVNIRWALRLGTKDKQFNLAGYKAM